VNGFMAASTPTGATCDVGIGGKIVVVVRPDIQAWHELLLEVTLEA
jgi:hypothetical protein